jgi:hypothetical protein
MSEDTDASVIRMKIGMERMNEIAPSHREERDQFLTNLTLTKSQLAEEQSSS